MLRQEERPRTTGDPNNQTAKANLRYDRLVRARLVRAGNRPLDEEIEDAIEVNTQQRSAEDFKEGVEAFKQHRKPNWPSMKDRA